LLRFFFIKLRKIMSGVAMDMQEFIEFGVDRLRIPMFGPLNE